jgi:hypothetical protein
MSKPKKICKKVYIFLLMLFLYQFASMNIGNCQNYNEVLFKRNTIFLDFSTKGAIYSINYDRIFNQRKSINLSGRIGFSILKDAIAFPVGINLFTGKGSSHVEFSLTFIPYIDHYKSFLSKNDLSDKYIYVVPGLGYRFQKPNGGFFFMLTVSPTIFLDPPSSNFWNMDPRLYFTGSLGLGLSF